MSKTDILDVVDNLIKLKDFDSNLLTKRFALNKVNEFISLRDENPKLSDSVICKRLNTNLNTMRKHFSDLNMTTLVKTPSKKSEQIKYSFDFNTNTYVRDMKSGTHIFNTVSRTFMEDKSPTPTGAGPLSLKSRIDQKRNSEAPSQSQPRTKVPAQTRVSTIRDARGAGVSTDLAPDSKFDSRKLVEDMLATP